MEQGKIYHLSYGGNTQLVGRFNYMDTCNYFFYDLLHYWNGSETFKSGSMCYSVKDGVEIRRASKAEIHSLVAKEIEHDCI